jgi:hypothetical protein
MSNAFGDLSATGFRGHTCAFCRVNIALEDRLQLPISILSGGRTFRCWAHRECAQKAFELTVAEQVLVLPEASPSEIRARRLAVVE